MPLDHAANRWKGSAVKVNIICFKTVTLSGRIDDSFL